MMKVVDLVLVLVETTAAMSGANTTSTTTTSTNNTAGMNTSFTTTSSSSSKSTTGCWGSNGVSVGSGSGKSGVGGNGVLVGSSSVGNARIELHADGAVCSSNSGDLMAESLDGVGVGKVESDSGSSSSSISSSSGYVLVDVDPFCDEERWQHFEDEGAKRLQQQQGDQGVAQPQHHQQLQQQQEAGDSVVAGAAAAPVAEGLTAARGRMRLKAVRKGAAAQQQRQEGEHMLGRDLHVSQGKASGQGDEAGMKQGGVQLQEGVVQQQQQQWLIKDEMELAKDPTQQPQLKRRRHSGEGKDGASDAMFHQQCGAGSEQQQQRQVKKAIPHGEPLPPHLSSLLWASLHLVYGVNRLHWGAARLVAHREVNLEVWRRFNSTKPCSCPFDGMLLDAFVGDAAIGVGVTAAAAGGSGEGDGGKEGVVVDVIDGSEAPGTSGKAAAAGTTGTAAAAVGAGEGVVGTAGLTGTSAGAETTGVAAGAEGTAGVAAGAEGTAGVAAGAEGTAGVAGALATKDSSTGGEMSGPALTAAAEATAKVTFGGVASDAAAALPPAAAGSARGCASSAEVVGGNGGLAGAGGDEGKGAEAGESKKDGVKGAPAGAAEVGEEAGGSNLNTDSSGSSSSKPSTDISSSIFCNDSGSSDASSDSSSSDTKMHQLIVTPQMQVQARRGAEGLRDAVINYGSNCILILEALKEVLPGCVCPEPALVAAAAGQWADHLEGAKRAAALSPDTCLFNAYERIRQVYARHQGWFPTECAVFLMLRADVGKGLRLGLLTTMGREVTQNAAVPFACNNVGCCSVEGPSEIGMVGGGRGLCGGCRQVWYCNEKCQEQCWEFHKVACKKAQRERKQGRKQGRKEQGKKAQEQQQQEVVVVVEEQEEVGSHEKNVQQ
jgi:hypothetical protein